MRKDAAMPGIDVDLDSDTLTRPTPAMRKAMAAAPVGDEQRGEDPSVNRLCAMVAELIGKEAAVFLPSCTMGNEIAFLVQCRPGDEVLADRTSHVWLYEAGAPAALAGVLVGPLDGRRGVFTPAQVEAAIREDSRWAPRTRLVSIEQTATNGGGKVWPLSAIQGVATTARRHGLALHIDGARLMNAVIASGVPASEYGALADTVALDLSKGLGCPVGSVLVGSADVIREAWRWKQRLGGAMRQAGILAAAGIYALDHHVERLAEDHANARLFAESIADLSGISVDPSGVETNIVIFDVTATGRDAADIYRRLLGQGVRIGVLDRTRLRAVTHLDVSRAHVLRAATVVRRVIGARRVRGQRLVTRGRRPA